MKYLINIIAIAFFLLLISCNSNNDKKNAKSNQDTDKSESNTVGEIQTIERDTLKQFLPSNIQGTNKRPYKTGSIYQDNVTITTCSSEYEFANKGFLDFSITDYGAKLNIPENDYNRFDNLPKVSGSVTSEVIIPSGKGYIVWDKSQKNGSFNGLILNRFILKIDAYRLPKSILDLQDYIKYFKIKELIEFYNKNS